jgi:hypothetical protein|tara:strand:+ start:243 stop:710 length:468 start_codon:yes stop_codon:yes gene_type:complete
MNDTEKMMYYSTEKKSPALGVVFEMLLPTSGYAYSGNFKRGLTRFGAKLIPVIFGSVMYNSAVLAEKCDGWDYDCEWENGDYYRNDETMMARGYAVAVYGYIIVEIINWFDVAKNVRDYNNRLFNNIFGASKNSNINTTLYPQKNGIRLQLSYVL